MLPSDLETLLQRWYPTSQESRLVGTEHRIDSGYFDIIRFYGQDAIDPSNCILQVQEDAFQLTDPIVKAFSNKYAQKLRAEQRLFDGPSVLKLSAIHKAPNGYRFDVQPCSYADQAGSCFAFDLPDPLFGEQTTLRGYLKSRSDSTDVKDNPLAICFGVCGYLIGHDSDGHWLLQIRRASNLSSMAKTLGPTVAGSVEFSRDYHDLSGIVSIVLGRETEEELALVSSECTITPLAFAREIVRGERPQLFAVIATDRSKQEVTERLDSIPQSEREFLEPRFHRFQSPGVLTELLTCVNPEARMNLLLLEEWLAGDSTL